MISKIFNQLVRKLLCYALFLLCRVSQCQVDGVYTGNLVSLNNALAFSSVKGGFVGTFYLNLDDKRVFFAEYSERLLFSQISMINQEPLNFYGKLIADSLMLVELRTSDSYTTLVYKAEFKKISSNPNFSLKGVLKKHLQRDDALIGKWILVKTAGSNGLVTQSDRQTVEYKKDGQFKLQSKMVDETFKGLFVKRPDLAITWETAGGKVILNGTTGVSHIESYQFIGDTLITSNINNTKSYYLRR